MCRTSPRFTDVTLAENADGTSNLTPITRGKRPLRRKPDAPAASPAQQVDLKKFASRRDYPQGEALRNGNRDF